MENRPPPAVVPGFADFTLLHSGKRLVYRCQRDTPEDHTSVVIKIHPDRSYIDPAKDAAFQREFDITRSLANVPGVVTIHEYVCQEKYRVLVFEDFGAESLAAFLTRVREAPARDEVFSLKQRLALCVRLADTLDAIHQHDVLHLDLKPSNILLNAKNWEMKVSDFGSAIRGNVTQTNRLIGTPAYVSPEQTGRTTVSVDRRSDLYSLGVVFYEMFTFRLPFDCTSPAEFIQAHIAKNPIIPRSVVPNLPLVLQKIIMKLLCKDKERRYESAFGLKADLQRAYHDLVETGRINDFDLADHDRSGQLRAPRRLWGRAGDVQRLSKALAEVQGGARQTILVDGASGVGKSALIEEFRRQANEANHNVLFAAGKADFAQRVPYGALGLAVAEIFASVHMQGAKTATATREILVSMLGSDIDVVTSILPATQMFFGVPQKDTLVEENSHARFTRSMCVLMRHFATASQPMVLYIDDIQWCDEATLRVIDALITNERIQHLLVICAYRTAELPKNLRTCLDESEAFKNAMLIHVQGLSAENVAELIVDVTGGQMSDARELGALCHKRTDGNPLHVMEVMRFLNSNDLLRFDLRTRSFTWDMSVVRGRINNTGDVAEMVSQRVRFLPDNVAKALAVAACLGTAFSAVLLRHVMGGTVDEVRAALSAARDASMVERHDGMINLSMGVEPVGLDDDEDAEPVAEEYFRFLHDKIHEAALKLLPEEQARTRMTIARLLLQRSDGAPFLRSKWQFEICDHLNAAAAMGADCPPHLLQTSVKLNLEACAASHKMLVFSAAKSYVRAAKRSLALLAEQTPYAEAAASTGTWAFDHETTMKLTIEEVALSLQTDEEAAADVAYEDGLAHARTLTEKARLMRTVVDSKVSKNKTKDALDAGRAALAMLGRPLPAPEDTMTFIGAIVAKHKLMDAREVEKLVDVLQVASSEESIVLADMLASFMAVLYLADMASLPALCALAWDIAIESGMAAALGPSMAMHGVMLGAGGQFDIAYTVGQTVRAVCTKHKLRVAEPIVHLLVGAMVIPWTRPISETYEPIQMATKAGIEVGDYNYVGFTYLHRHFLQFVEGQALTALVREIPEHLAFARQSKNLLCQGCLTVTLRAAAKLMHNERFAQVIQELGEGVIDDENAFKASIAAVPYYNTAYIIMGALVAYVNDRVSECLRLVEQAEGMVQTLSGHTLIVLVPFLHAMCLLRQTHGELDEARAAKIAADSAKLKVWADAAPANYRSMYLLVEAELLRVQHGDQSAIIGKYSEAVTIASQYNCLYMIGMIHETAARYWTHSETGIFANEYRECHVKHAIAAYRAWGAVAKAEMMRTRGHHELAADTASRHHPSSNETAQETHTLATLTTDGSITDELDALFLLKASQAISSELRPDRLFDIALPILMESSGAEHACLLSLDEETQTIVMEAKSSEAVDRDSTLSELPPFMSLDIGAKIKPSDILLPLVNLVAGTMEPRIITDALKDLKFWNDPYVQAHRPRSVLCAGLTSRGKLSKILYMENNQYPGTFTQRRLTFVKVLLNQAAISWENARLYAQFEVSARALANQVAERKAEMAGALAAANAARESAIYASHAKSASLASMAHELRTPMNAVVSLAQLLLVENKLTDEQRENVEIIKTSGEALVRLVDSILDISKLEASKLKLEMAPGDIRDCIRDCCLVLKVKAAEKHLELRSDVEEAIPHVLVADMLRVRQIVINLLGNALKFTDRGYVRVSLSATPLPGPVNLGEATWTVTPPEDAPWYEVHGRVQDSGIGISQDGIAKLFRPFEQVDSSAERRHLGTGLGLVISKNLCELMGGRMWVESLEGQGSTFHFTLCVPALPGVILPTASAESVVTSNTVPLRLLVVDDHAINLKVVTKMLTRLGYTAQTAGSGQEALTAIKTAPEPFDAVFMDLHMPNGIDGFEATKRLRSELELAKQPRVIALTADTMVEGRERLTEAGFDDYLCKPVKLAELMSAIRLIDPLRKTRLDTSSGERPAS